MKKALIGLGVAYMVIAVGVGVYYIANPEAYGAMYGKFLTGFVNACEELKKED